MYAKGELVLITHTQGREKLCVLGVVIGPAPHYRQGITVDTIWKHDPGGIDSHIPGEWSTYGCIHIERWGSFEPPSAV